MDYSCNKFYKTMR